MWTGYSPSKTTKGNPQMPYPRAPMYTVIFEFQYCSIVSISSLIHDVLSIFYFFSFSLIGVNIFIFQIGCFTFSFEILEVVLHYSHLTFYNCIFCVGLHQKIPGLIFPSTIDDVIPKFFLQADSVASNTCVRKLHENMVCLCFIPPPFPKRRFCYTLYIQLFGSSFHHIFVVAEAMEREAIAEFTGLYGPYNSM